MRKLLAVGLLAVAGSVQAADWVHITDDNSGGAYFIDKDTIKTDKKNNTVTVWLKTEGGLDDYFGQKITSRISQIKYVCEGRMYNILYGILYSYDKVVSSRSIGESSDPIIPGSANETLYEVVCLNPALGHSQTSTSSATTADAAESSAQAAYDDLFSQAYNMFMARPENSVFVEGTQAWDILDQQVRLVGAELGNKIMPIEIFNLARAKTAKLISIPPLPSQKKTQKPIAQPKADSRRSVYL